MSGFFFLLHKDLYPLSQMAVKREITPQIERRPIVFLSDPVTQSNFSRGQDKVRLTHFIVISLEQGMKSWNLIEL